MMALAVTVFACFGFLSPANRGGMMTALLLLYVFMGSFAGYFSARIYKMYGGEAWKRNTLITSLFFPVRPPPPRRRASRRVGRTRCRWPHTSLRVAHAWATRRP